MSESPSIPPTELPARSVAMSESPSIPPTELSQAAALVRSLPHVDALAALCHDVIGRQAEGRALFVGKKFVSGRAKAHKVERAKADTPLGNVLTLLERGPESTGQWALLAALFVRGFGAAVHKSPEQRAALCTKLASQVDWLELSSPYRVLPLLDELLEPELGGEVHAALAALVLRDDGRRDPEMRAKNAGRIASLGEARSQAARTGLERIEAQARDVYSSTLAALALGKTPSAEARSYAVRGRVRAMPPGPFLRALRWLSGYALASAALRALLAGLGLLREVEVELQPDSIRVRGNTFVLGRLVRSVERLHPLVRLRSARRAARYPSLFFLVGSFSFALGLLLGGVFAFDAARSGDRTLWLIAGSLLLGGSGLDLVLEAIVPGTRGRVVLDLYLGRPYRLRVSGISLEDADRFLQELARRLSRAEGGRRAVA